MNFVHGRDTPYAKDTRTYAQGGIPSQHEVLQAMPFGFDSLANRGARPIGRSANDPMRIAEQMRRKGDPSAILDFAHARFQQQFYDGQQDKVGQQHLWTAQQTAQAQAQQAAQEQLQKQQDWQRQQEALKQRDEQDHQQALQMFGLRQGAHAMDQERERQQKEQDRLRPPNVGAVPVPGSNYLVPFANGNAMGTVPSHATSPIQNMPIPGTSLYQPQQNGKPVPGAPMLQQQHGPFREGLTKMQPVPGEVGSDAKREKAHIIYPGESKEPHEVVYGDDGSVKGYRKLTLLDEETAPAAEVKPSTPGQGGWKSLLPPERQGVTPGELTSGLGAMQGL